MYLHNIVSVDLLLIERSIMKLYILLPKWRRQLVKGVMKVFANPIAIESKGTPKPEISQK